MKLYIMAYGNGYNGNKENIGTFNVIAENAQGAKDKLHKAEGIKLGHMKVKYVERVIV